MPSVLDVSLLDAVFDAVLDALVVADEAGIILQANSAASGLFGFDPDALIGRSVNSLMPDEIAFQHDEFLKDYLRTGEKKILGTGREVTGLRKDGTSFPLFLSVSRADAQGQLLFVAVMHDLTRQHADRSALARSERLDAIGQMTGGIAHDFNNLLAVILGNLELLEGRITDPKQGALLNDAIGAAELGADLTSRLLIFARKSELAPQPLDLREVCRATVEMLKNSLGSQYRIEERFATDVDRILADRVQLQSAMVNLAMNARDAMPDGGTLSCSITNFEIDDDYMAQELDIEKGAYVRLSLSDTGGGMAPSTKDHAFEPFFTTKASGKGTGLGLAMVHGFVRQSGGHVTLYSEVGQGTTVSLYFPAVDHPEESRPLSAAGPDLDGAGRTILVVEDNDTVRRLSVERLIELGFDVVETNTADEAWSLLQGGAAVDLVLTDLMMPGKLNGRDLADRIAREFSAIKVLLTSGYAQELVDNGHVPLLRKPFRQVELIKALQAILRAE